MVQAPALRLLKGHTTHQRSAPFMHRFKYGLALIDIDVDRLDEAAAQSALFGVDKSNLFSFNRRDHGERKSKDLRLWADRHFEGAGIELNGGAVRLVTFPRHAFYKFAPISIWLGHDPQGNLAGVLYEVNNTFGETHTYVASTPNTSRNRHIGDKQFHVSPFFDISGKYQFTLRYDANQFSLIVATMHGDKQTHMASIKTKAQNATNGAFAKLAIRRPISSLGVTFAIHWQALRLLLKGAKYHSKPKQSDARTTYTDTEKAAPEATSTREKAA